MGEFDNYEDSEDWEDGSSDNDELYCKSILSHHMSSGMYT